MTEEICVAIIGAGGVIIAAIISLFKKSELKKKMIIITPAIKGFLTA